MKALGFRLRQAKPRLARPLHLQPQEASILAVAQSHRPSATSHYKSPSAAVSRHLSQGRAGAALAEFQGLLQDAQPPDTLEKCIQYFGQHRQYEHMKKALSGFLDYGYSPSSELWSHVLHAAGLEANAPTDIRPYFQQGLHAMINDEASLLSLIRYTARYGLIEIGEKLFERYRARLQQDLEDSNAEPPPAFWAALIDGRARISDLDGAFIWFMRWRISPTHPGFRSDDAVSLLEGSRNYTGRLAAVAPAHVALRNIFAPLDSNDTQNSPYAAATSLSTARQDPVLPDPAPYLALLKHFAGPGSMPSLRLLELMATDGVPLTTGTMNGLIDSEYKRKEKGQLVSVLSLYDMMRSNPNAAYQPDRFTFHTIFRTYREPRIISSSANPSPGPTKLARMAELPPPPEELLYNPRALFSDMCAKHFSMKHGTSAPALIDAGLLEVAIGAFVRTRDFTGCAAALSLYGILRIEPSAKLHAIITFGLLRARTRKEAFQRRDRSFNMSDEEATRLRRHIGHLNDLEGFERPIVARAFKLNSPTAESQDAPIFVIQNNMSEVRSSRDDFAMRSWNNRLVPRAESELDSTRRYEFRYIAPVIDLLRRASGLDMPEWTTRVKELERGFRSRLGGQSPS